MTRSVLAVAALVLMALVGLTAALAVYDLASIYGDPTGSELAMFVPFGVPGLIVVTLLLGAAASAVALSRGRMRRPVTVTAAVIAGVSIIGIVVGNHYGVEDKRADTARPPECGIQNIQSSAGSSRRSTIPGTSEEAAPRAATARTSCPRSTARRRSTSTPTDCAAGGTPSPGTPTV